jgi:hypothetical protein
MFRFNNKLYLLTVGVLLNFVGELDFHHFSTSRPGPYKQLNESCFHLWENVWTDTFRELNVQKLRLNSDSFLNKELGGLFLKDRPIGFLLYHFCDLSIASQQRMSYFDNYPGNFLKQVFALNENIMIITYMTLDPSWRKSMTDLPVSELLMGFSVLRFMETESKRLLGYFRNNRSTQNIFYRHGGIPLLKAQEAYNVEVDFAQITRESALLSEIKNCSEMTIRKWNEYKYNNGGLNEERSNDVDKNGKTGRDLFENGLG